MVPPPDAFVGTVFYRLRARGFTLVELLVAMVVFTIMMTFLISTVSQASTIWQHSRNEIGSYQSVRFAFNLMTRTLAQSRMNVYQDYDDATTPTKYLRKSDLEFVIDDPQSTPLFNQGNSIFFQAPLGQTDSFGQTTDKPDLGGLPGTLNTVGYYVTYGKDPNLPSFLTNYDRNRFRLIQMLVPTENMTVSTPPAGSTGIDHSWYTSHLPPAEKKYVNVVANNVILLLCWPRLSEQEDPTGDALTQIQGSTYRYDSRLSNMQDPQPPTANQQPPLVQVTFVAVDDTWANRLPDSSTPPAQITDALQGLFTKSTVTDYTADLAKLESRLSSAHVGYRVFK